jgi:hypothetical protein
LADELRRYLDKEPLKHTRPPGPIRRLARTIRKSPAVFALLGVVAAVLTINLALMWGRVREKPTPMSLLDPAAYTPQQIALLEEVVRSKEQLYCGIRTLYENGSKGGEAFKENSARLELCSALAKLYGAQGKAGACLLAQECAVEAAKDAVDAYEAMVDTEGQAEVAKARIRLSEAELQLENIRRDIAQQRIAPAALEVAEEDLLSPKDPRLTEQQTLDVPESPPVGVPPEIPSEPGGGVPLPSVGPPSTGELLPPPSTLEAELLVRHRSQPPPRLPFAKPKSGKTN